MIEIYHNPRCKKSRAGLEHLKNKGVDYKVIEYLKNPITEKDLKNILVKMNKRPQEIIRTQEEVYKKQYKGKDFTDDEWIRIMVENPKLIQRPIVVKDYKAVFADPPDKMDKLF